MLSDPILYQIVKIALVSKTSSSWYHNHLNTVWFTDMEISKQPSIHNKSLLQHHDDCFEDANAIEFAVHVQASNMTKL